MAQQSICRTVHVKAPTRNKHKLGQFQCYKCDDRTLTDLLSVISASSCDLADHHIEKRDLEEDTVSTDAADLITNNYLVTTNIQ